MLLLLLLLRRMYFEWSVYEHGASAVYCHFTAGGERCTEGMSLNDAAYERSIAACAAILQRWNRVLVLLLLEA